jgi:UDP-N-acetyl-D-mannosaminuronic acid transferase (WecB/TagA/CpsF family)
VAIVPQLGKAREKAAKTVGVSHGYFSDASRDPIEGEIAQFRA